MPNIIGGKRYFRTAEAAKEVGVSRQTLLRWFRERTIPDVKKRDRHGWRLISEEELGRLKSWAQSMRDAET
jgi:excisionase family DNA binding protein